MAQNPLVGWGAGRHGIRDQEAPQAHAQEEAQEDAEGHPLAAAGSGQVSPTSCDHLLCTERSLSTLLTYFRVKRPRPGGRSAGRYRPYPDDQGPFGAEVEVGPTLQP